LPSYNTLLSHFVYLTLLSLSFSPSLFLHFHTSRHLVHLIFSNCFPEINLCSWFFSVLVPLYWHSLYSTNVTTSYFVFHSFSSNTMLLRGMSYMLQYSCTFLYRKYTGFLSSCCAFYGMVTCVAISLTHLSLSFFLLGCS